MHLDPAMPYLVGVILAILILGIIFRFLNQPYVIGYLIAGVILGPQGMAIVKDEILMSRLGTIGVVLLLFFIGMEISPRKLIDNWRMSIIGTLLQITISVGIIWLLGISLDWPVERIILIGFVICLSSTAVILKLLQDWRELETRVGQNVLSILIAQDLAVIPMLIILSYLGESNEDYKNILMQLIGALSIAGILFSIAKNEVIRLPFGKFLRNDYELQIFTALFICLGLSLFTGLAGLSTALGAFVAGIIIGAAKETQWVYHSLESFRVVFVALFFVSIGMLLDLEFIATNWALIGTLVILVLVTNIVINGAILKLLGEPWKECIYAGALLSQIGEFSFVLAAVGIQAGIISNYGYQITIAIISVTLLISPPWIMIVKYMLKIK